MLVCITISVLLISSLLVYSKIGGDRPNGFTRNLLPNPLSLKNYLYIKFNSYYIAGIDSGHIFLANPTAPTYLLAITHALADTHFVKLPTKKLKKIYWNSVKASVNKHNVYMLEGTTSSFQTGQLFSKDTLMYYSLDSINFINGISVSPVSIIYRKYDKKADESYLVKMSLKKPIETAQLKLDKQTDGLFSTDGVLISNQEKTRFIYLYYYRNKYDALDSNLHLLYTGNTIDTTNVAKIKVTDIASEKTTTMAIPPFLVNSSASINNKYLFIQSRLRADNESSMISKKYTVFDAYDINNWKYSFSFYIPNHNNENLNSFVVNENILFALFDSYLVTYALSF